MDITIPNSKDDSQMRASGIQVHKHCQETVCSAHGYDGSGHTWNLISQLYEPNDVLSNITRCLDSNETWLGYFSGNDRNITEDLRAILMLIDKVAARTHDVQTASFQQEYNLLPARSRMGTRITDGWAKYDITISPQRHVYRIWEPEYTNAVVEINLDSIYSNASVYGYDSGQYLDIIEFELHVSNLRNQAATSSSGLPGIADRNLILPQMWLHDEGNEWKFLFGCPTTVYGGSDNDPMNQVFTANFPEYTNYYQLAIPAGHIYAYRFRLDRLVKLAFIDLIHDYYTIAT